ncbi:MAG TPA: ABC-2 family transporter protein [Acidimicrobiia bacterium]|nr:ABC-2 family transporter protein [Acidimicrobiia bacterium]
MTGIYRSLLKAYLSLALTYRARLGVWILTSLFPLLMLAVWLSVVDEVGVAAGWDTSDFVTYYAGAAFLYHSTTSFLTWIWDQDLRTGDLSFKLLKPVAPFHHYLSQEVGFRAVVVAILLPLLMVLTWVVPTLHFPASPLEWSLAVIATISGFLLNVLTSMAFATIGFWTTQAGNIYSLWWGMGAFLSGWIAPLALLPDPVRRAAELLPFRASLGLPLEIALGRLSGAEIGFGFAVTAFWLAVFTGFYQLGWRRGVRRYQAVGG